MADAFVFDEGKEYGSQFFRQMFLAGISATSISQPALTAENAIIAVLPLNYNCRRRNLSKR